VLCHADVPAEDQHIAASIVEHGRCPVLHV
jgi:hypothetical protein